MLVFNQGEQNQKREEGKRTDQEIKINSKRYGADLAALKTALSLSLSLSPSLLKQT
jgi:hypothetical protein